MSIHDDITTDGTEDERPSALTSEQQARSVSPTAAALRTYIRELSDATLDRGVLYWSVCCTARDFVAGTAKELDAFSLAETCQRAAVGALLRFVGFGTSPSSAFATAASEARRCSDEHAVMRATAIQQTGAEAQRRIDAANSANGVGKPEAA